MFYYKRHIGDYRSATNHLTLLEHGVYCCLMDTYYLNEQALPNDERQLFRIAGARTEEEKQAVIDVVNEFFNPTETQWVHSRIEFELKDYQSKAGANRENGKKGGRPSKKPKENPSGFDSVENKTQVDSEMKPKANPNETLTNKPINLLTNEPLNNISDTSDLDKPTRFMFNKELMALGCDKVLVGEYMAHRKNKKASNSKIAFDGLIREQQKSGMDLNCVMRLCIERGWRGFEAEWVNKPITQNNYQQQNRPPNIGQFMRNNAEQFFDVSEDQIYLENKQ